MDVMLSIICNTYNHGNYIRDALEGFLMQETSFPFEVLVHDDASTDQTADIISDYAKRYPNIIKPIIQKDNQYSKGISINREFQIPRAKGKYFATCECDDYWTDKNKVQKQVMFLEEHPGIDMCAHRAEQVFAETGTHCNWVAPIDHDGLLTTADVIQGSGAYIATASLVYRREIETKPTMFRLAYQLDYTLQVSGAIRGGIYFFNDCMSVYRFLAPGSWTKTISKDVKRKIEHKEKMMKVFRLIDSETHHKYTKELIPHIIDNRAKTIILKGQDYIAGVFRHV